MDPSIASFIKEINELVARIPRPNRRDIGMSYEDFEKAVNLWGLAHKYCYILAVCLEHFPKSDYYFEQLDEMEKAIGEALRK